MIPSKYTEEEIKDILIVLPWLQIKVNNKIVAYTDHIGLEEFDKQIRQLHNDTNKNNCKNGSCEKRYDNNQSI